MEKIDTQAKAAAVKTPTLRMTTFERWEDAHVTKPDFVTYIPTEEGVTDEQGAFLVTPTPKGTFLACWQQGEGHEDPRQRIVLARSEDRGRTWSRPMVIDGPEEGTTHVSTQFFPVVVPHTGRIYAFFHKNTGPVGKDLRLTGVLAWRVSDDDGLTWGERYQASIRRSVIDNADPNLLSDWIYPGCQVPVVDTRGRVLCPFTRFACDAYHMKVQPDLKGGIKMNNRHHESWFLRLENVFTESDPSKLVVTTLPKAEHGICVPGLDKSPHSRAMEPAVVNLSGGRILCMMRTMTGSIWYAVSEDYGESWGPADVLRFIPGGAPVPHPNAPCPIFNLRDGRYILFFHNNDGSRDSTTAVPFNGSCPSRRQVYISVGREIHNPGGQPLMFGAPRLFLDNHDAPPVVTGGHCGIPNYGSFTDYAGERIWWYTDRFLYAVGKLIPEELLDDTWLPR